jgi:dTDP-3-amino-3,4,6-trideoxy-alpha-D-glucose transaminase
MDRSPLPLFDLARRWPAQREQALAAFERVAAAGRFSLGPELEAFERELAADCSVAHAVGVSSGTAAIELALRALGAGPGTEVVTVAHTFVATVEAIAATGARPVLVDIDPGTRCIDPVAVAAALTPETAAVVAVHLYGRPAPMAELRQLCRDAGVALVEDAAQAHGAVLDGARAGSLADAAAFSFYPTKNLGAMGDGGAVVCDEPGTAAVVRSLRHHGSAADDANHHERQGGTERLDELQAALLRLRLRDLDADNELRRAAAQRYRTALAAAGVELPPDDPENGRQVFHLFVVEVDDRDRVRARLNAEGIGAAVHYPTPVHLQPAWRHLAPAGTAALPHTERLASRVLSLPLFPGIEEHEVDRVAGALRRAVAG